MTRGRFPGLVGVALVTVPAVLVLAGVAGGLWGLRRRDAGAG